MRTVMIFIIGGLAGFGAAMLMGKTEKRIVRVDSVTIERSELREMIDAMNTIKNRSLSPSYARFETDSRALAFECPTERACNLEVTAREKEVSRPKVVLLKSVSETAAD